MKFIIWGCNGKIGNDVAKKLIQAGHKVIFGIDNVKPDSSKFSIYTKQEIKEKKAQYVKSPSSAGAMIAICEDSDVEDVLNYALKYKIPLIINAHDLSQSKEKEIEDAAKYIPIICARCLSARVQEFLNECNEEIRSYIDDFSLYDVRNACINIRIQRGISNKVQDKEMDIAQIFHNEFSSYYNDDSNIIVKKLKEYKMEPNEEEFVMSFACYEKVRTIKNTLKFINPVEVEEISLTIVRLMEHIKDIAQKPEIYFDILDILENESEDDYEEDDDDDYEDSEEDAKAFYQNYFAY